MTPGGGGQAVLGHAISDDPAAARACPSVGPLKGRTAVVTGAAGGLGVGVVEALRDAGARVFALDLAAPPGPDGRALDVRSPDEVAAAFEEIAAEVGGIDVLVNCHGVLQAFGPVAETTDDELRRVMSVNFEGTFVTCREAARLMRGRGWGRIINVASQAGRVPWPNIAIYGASKAAVISLSQALAGELGPEGITVNAVCPGVMRTAMTDGAFAVGAADTAETQARLAAKAASLPVRRLGTPGDVGATVAWLASPAAGFITGTAVNLTGGEQTF